MKKIMLTLVMLSVCAGLFAQKKGSLAVFSFTGGNEEAIASSLTRQRVFRYEGRESINIADGKDCLNTMAWSRESFVQSPQGKRGLRIRYEFFEKPKTITFGIDTPKTEDFWKIGVMLGDNLQLHVCTGDEANHTCAGDLDVSLT